MRPSHFLITIFAGCLISCSGGLLTPQGTVAAGVNSVSIAIASTIQ